ncbi:type 2 periplasmic-binding domain-containing protein [Facilibium subflavum]|uniref:hypothetical protein n=1 Tax=Facilibium subflavum TaxID=2219058 RepID=UPI0013C35CA4|nr:hypothetical protein [Facilibium subflavum]
MKGYWNWKFYDQNKQLIHVPVNTDLVLDTEIMQAYAVSAGWGIAQISESVVTEMNKITHTDIVEILPEYKLQTKGLAIYENTMQSHPFKEEVLAVLRNYYMKSGLQA